MIIQVISNPSPDYVKMGRNYMKENIQELSDEQINSIFDMIRISDS